MGLGEEMRREVEVAETLVVDAEVDRGLRVRVEVHLVPMPDPEWIAAFEVPPPGMEGHEHAETLRVTRGVVRAHVPKDEAENWAERTRTRVQATNDYFTGVNNGHR